MKLGFDGGIKFEFHSAKVTSDYQACNLQDLTIRKQENLFKKIVVHTIHSYRRLLGFVNSHDFDMGNIGS